MQYDKLKEDDFKKRADELQRKQSEEMFKVSKEQLKRNEEMFKVHDFNRPTLK